MLQYQLLIYCTVRKQAEAIYKTGKQTAYIANLCKTELIINIDTLTCTIFLEYHDISIPYKMKFWQGVNFGDW